jgi:hypothetical protein
MHIIIWKLMVREERIQQFKAASGCNGDWANLFRLRKAIWAPNFSAPLTNRTSS